jgi:hypothetical protein
MYFMIITTVSRTALGPTQPPIQWVQGAFSLGVKRPGCEADHSPHLVPGSKNEWTYTSTPQYAFMAWCSVKGQGQLYLYIYLYLAYLCIGLPSYLFPSGVPTIFLSISCLFHACYGLLGFSSILSRKFVPSALKYATTIPISFHICSLFQ